MESNNRTFEARINPLSFLKVDKPWSEVRQCPPDSDDILEMLCTPGLAHDPVSLAGRWNEISIESNRLCVVPNEEVFLDRLIWPLRHAKSGYMLGNYLGTIALCGTVAEMLAILLYEIATVSLGGKPITAKEEELLFGRTFENLGQDQRVKVLRVLGQIDDEVRVLFDGVRAIRKKYLHLYSQSHEGLAADAVMMFDKTVNLVVKGLGFRLHNTGLEMRQDLVAYLRKLGVVDESAPPTTPE